MLLLGAAGVLSGEALVVPADAAGCCCCMVLLRSSRTNISALFVINKGCAALPLGERARINKSSSRLHGSRLADLRGSCWCCSVTGSH